MQLNGSYPITEAIASQTLQIMTFHPTTGFVLSRWNSSLGVIFGDFLRGENVQNMAVGYLHLKIQQDLLFLQALAVEKNVALNFQVEEIPDEGIEVTVDIAGEGTEFFDQETITSAAEWTDFYDDLQFAVDAA